MTKPEAERTAVLTAAAVIVLLTAAAFWLSYAHLASVASNNGLSGSTARLWAWPATLDLFIIAGEVLMFRAALQSRIDRWAIGLTVAGSLGSIGLNVAGVGSGQPALHYVVAAVPPSAALLAFGALMRQVHTLVAPVAPEPEPVEQDMPVEEPAEHFSVERIPDPAPELPAPAPDPAQDKAPAVIPPAAPRPALPALPVALVDHARKVADDHHARTGTPIDADTLRTRLGVPPILADALTAQLT